MKLNKKSLLKVAIIVLVAGYVINISKDPQVIALIFLIIGAIYMENFNLQKQLHYVEEKVDRDITLNYKLDITIRPNYLEIIKWIAETQKKSVHEFVDNLLKDKDLTLSKKKTVQEFLDSFRNDKDLKNGLFGKEFSFTVFSSELTGIDQVWSYEHKCFLHEIKAKGHIF